MLYTSISANAMSFKHELFHKSSFLDDCELSEHTSESNFSSSIYKLLYILLIFFLFVRIIFNILNQAVCNNLY